MRHLFTLVLLLAVTAGAAVDASAADTSMVIASPSKNNSGCNLSVAGFKSKDQFLRFFAELQSAAKSSDKEKLSGLVAYPLLLNFGTKRYGQMKRKLKDKKEFIANFQAFFSKKVQTALEEQKVTDLFCNNQGVMVGRGEVWIAPRGNVVGMITINN